MNHSHAMLTYFNTAAPSWDEHSRVDAQVLKRIFAVADIQPQSRVLDVACGTGVLFPALLAHRPRLLRAIDCSPEMVQIARDKHAHHPALQISCTDFYEFDECNFDFIMIFNAYPHFLDKVALARQLRRCLAPHGRFIIAHSRGRARINHCHDRRGATAISTPLLSCQSEAQRLGSEFSYDAMVDEEHFYLLSGTRA